MLIKYCNSYYHHLRCNLGSHKRAQQMEQMNNPFEEKQTTGKSLRQFKLSAESIAVLDAIRKTNKATNSEIVEMLLIKAGKNYMRGE